MSAPFIFIATNTLREGKLPAERERAADLSDSIKANEPQLLASIERSDRRPPWPLACHRCVRSGKRLLQSDL
jgi:hypothetical protein